MPQIDPPGKANASLAIHSIHIWLNERLGRHGLHCYDFARDLSDGVLLFQLLEAEELPGLNSTYTWGISNFGALKYDDGSSGSGLAARESNIKMLLNYLESQGIFCAGLEQMIPDIIGDDGDESDETDDLKEECFQDAGNEAVPILLLVWKIFEHLRGRHALFGAPIPMSPTMFATEMLAWAQRQCALNHEASAAFPARVPHDLTTRYCMVKMNTVYS
jgi:hypothetical protein